MSRGDPMVRRLKAWMLKLVWPSRVAEIFLLSKVAIFVVGSVCAANI